MPMRLVKGLGVSLLEVYQETTFRKPWTKSTDLLFCFLDENNHMLEYFQEETVVERLLEGHLKVSRLPTKINERMIVLQEIVIK